MGGWFELRFQQVMCLILIICGASCSTKASVVVISINNTPQISNTASQGDESVSYTVHTEKLTWNEAKQKCIESGGRLAVINTYGKARLVGDFEPFDCHVWVGISRSSPTQAWSNAHDGSPVSNVPWAPNQPSGSHNCLAVQGCHRGLGAEDCAARKGFVCEKPKERPAISGSMSLEQICHRLVAPAASTTEQNCTCADRTSEEKEIKPLPYGYVPILNSGVAYKIFKPIPRITWIEAKRRCESEGAHLAVPDNEEKYESLIGSRLTGWVHIGIHRVDGRYVSVHDGSVFSNLPWSSDAYGNNECVLLHTTSEMLSNLYDVDCNELRAEYACELPIPRQHV